MVIDREYVESLIENNVRKGLLLRYKDFTTPTMVKVNSFDGTIKITTCLPSNNWCGVELSIRGCKYVHDILDKLSKEFPKFSDYMNGLLDNNSLPEYDKDVNWAVR